MIKQFFVLLTLCNCAVGQEPVPFNGETEELLNSLKEVGTGQLPRELEEARDLTTLKRLRVQAAQDQVETLQARYQSGLDNIDFLLRAQIELTLAKLDTTDLKAKQLDYIREGLESAILGWQRARKLQKLGARGGAASAQSRLQVLKFYVWWQKCNAGVKLGPTLVDPGDVPR